ncbi:hypothetical protein JHK82_047720 [Glycine max]|nr:hypothetical protein JHK82_047720 [Glycine max]
MPRGERLVVPFDSQLRVYGEAATLLSSACGRIATDSKNIPNNFDSWSNVPKSYKDGCFNIVKDKMTQEMSKSDNFTKILANDSVGKVLGKDHDGRVRCLGLGGLHSVAFRSTTSFSGSWSSFSNFDSVESSRLKEEVTCLRDKLTTSEENVKTLKMSCLHTSK